MHTGPDTPSLGDTAGFTGHLWVQELPTAGQFRFQVADSGLITFATPEVTCDTVEAVPLPFRRAAETIQRGLDRQALSTATDGPGSITFAGLAPRYEGIEYAWASLPEFLGVDVWAGEWLAPDAATTVYERLNVPTLPVVKKEAPVEYTDLDQYATADGFPTSAWREGPAAGVLVRDKTGTRGQAWHPAVSDATPEIRPEPVSDLADRYASEERIERLVQSTEGWPASASVDAVRDRLVATVARREYARLFRDGEFVVSRSDFEAAVGERIQRYLSDL